MVERAGRPVEVDERGRRVDPSAVLRRGMLTVGLQLLEERQRDLVAGRPHRRLTATETRCLLEAQGREIYGRQS